MTMKRRGPIRPRMSRQMLLFPLYLIWEVLQGISSKQA